MLGFLNYQVRIFMASKDFELEKNTFKDFYDLNKTLHEHAKDSFLNIVTAFIKNKDFLISNIHGRVKDREECISKFSRKYQTRLEEENKEYEIKDYISDLIGIRIICLYETDIYQIREILLKEFEVIDITDKTKEMNEKDNSFGYKGLHLDLKLNADRRKMSEYKEFVDLRFEVQIRTIVQDAWSVLDHKIQYKKTPPIPIKRRINTLAALFELADREFYSIKNEIEKIQDELKKQSSDKSLNEPLDAFNFQSIAEEFFPEYEFQAFKVDGFVDEILSYNNNITAQDFHDYLSAQQEKIETYKESNNHFNGTNTFKMNPYTEIRHILYIADKMKYQRLLYNLQRDNFENWLNEYYKGESTKHNGKIKVDNQK